MSFCPSIFLANFFSSAVQYFFVSIESWGVVGLVWFVGGLFGFVVGWLGFCLCCFCLWGGGVVYFLKFTFAFHFFLFAIVWLMLLFVCLCACYNFLTKSQRAVNQNKYLG